MTETFAGAAAADEASLLLAVRAGSSTAVEELWRRHRAAAHGFASSLTQRFDADDLTSEAFTRVLSTIRNGRGPTDAFRPYLFVAIRNVAITWSKSPATQSWEDTEEIAFDAKADGALIDRVNRDKLVEAMDTLPEQWRRVLWATEVEGLRPAELAEALDLKPNAVAALSYRAREALKQAWVQVHVGEDLGSGEHRWVRERAGRYVCHALTPRQRQRFISHLDCCAPCASAVRDAEHLAVLPIGAIALLLTLGDSASRFTGTAGAAATVHASRVGATPRHIARVLRRGSLQTVGAASVLAGVVVAGAFALSQSPEPPPPTSAVAQGPAAGTETTRPQSNPPSVDLPTSPKISTTLAPEGNDFPVSSPRERPALDPRPSGSPEPPSAAQGGVEDDPRRPESTPTPTPRSSTAFTLSTINAGSAGIATVEISNDGPSLPSPSDSMRGSIAVFRAPEGVTFLPQRTLRNDYLHTGSQRAASTLAFRDCSVEDDARLIRCEVDAAQADSQGVRDWVWRSGDSRRIHIAVRVEAHTSPGALAGSAQVRLVTDSATEVVFDREWVVDAARPDADSVLVVDTIDPSVAEPLVGGSGPAGCSVGVARDGELLAATTVGEDGRWAIAVPGVVRGRLVAQATCPSLAPPR